MAFQNSGTLKSYARDGIKIPGEDKIFPGKAQTCPGKQKLLPGFPKNTREGVKTSRGVNIFPGEKIPENWS